MVNGEIYLWKHNYNNCDYSVPLCLLILLEKDRKAAVRVKFPLKDSTIEKCMLNSGFKATKNSMDVIINLNQPKYIAEIIQYLASHKMDFSTGKKHLFENGWQLFNEMGYAFITTV